MMSGGMKMYSQAQKKATLTWESKNYEQIKFTAPIGFKERLKEASKNAGCSMRGYIISTLEEKMKEDAK